MSAPSAATVTLVHTHATEPAELVVRLKGGAAGESVTRYLCHEQLNAHNTFAAPERVVTKPSANGGESGWRNDPLHAAAGLGQPTGHFDMMKSHHVPVLVASVLLSLPRTPAQRLPPEVVVSNPRTYEVTITTKFVVPENGKHAEWAWGLARFAQRTPLGRPRPDARRIGNHLPARRVVVSSTLRPTSRRTYSGNCARA